MGVPLASMIPGLSRKIFTRGLAVTANDSPASATPVPASAFDPALFSIGRNRFPRARVFPLESAYIRTLQCISPHVKLRRLKP